MSAGDLVFRALLVVAAGGLVAGACLVTVRWSERPRQGLAIERGDRRARRRVRALRCATGIVASSALLAAPAFVWPDLSVGVTAALVAGALAAPLPWLRAAAGGAGWSVLGGWAACASIVGGALWLLAGSVVAAKSVPGRLEQDATLAAMRELGEAWETWRAERPEDPGGAGLRAPSRSVDLSELPELSAERLAAVLVPRYLSSIPRLDGWGRPLELRGSLGPGPRLAIRSPGADGVYSGDEYGRGLLLAGALDGDLVWVDGGFVRQPAD